MDSKTLATVMVIFICILLVPVGIGIIGGIFGVIGSVLGAVFGIIGGLLGAIFGVIGGIFGWIFYGDNDWNWPNHFFHWDFFTVFAIALVIILITRRKPSGTQR